MDGTRTISWVIGMNWLITSIFFSFFCPSFYQTMYVYSILYLPDFWFQSKRPISPSLSFFPHTRHHFINRNQRMPRVLLWMQMDEQGQWVHPKHQEPQFYENVFLLMTESTNFLLFVGLIIYSFFWQIILYFSVILTTPITSARAISNLHGIQPLNSKILIQRNEARCCQEIPTYISVKVDISIPNTYIPMSNDYAWCFHVPTPRIISDSYQVVHLI
jgi:hypothetical protein